MLYGAGHNSPPRQRSRAIRVALGTHQGKADLTRPSPLRVNLSEVPMGEREHWYFECMADAADQGDGKSSDR